MISRFAYVQAFEKPFERFLPPRCWIAIRLDGNKFTPFTKHLVKPVDERLRLLFTQSARILLQKENDLSMAYCQSDEISFIINRNSNWFSRRSDKIVSHISSNYASIFTRNACTLENEIFDDPCVAFDARISCLHNFVELRDYLRWRQWQGWRNYVSSLIYYKMLEEGLTPQEVDIEVNEANVKDKIKMMQELYGWNINLHSPVEHKNGTTLIRTQNVIEKNIKSEDDTLKNIKQIVEKFERFSDEKWISSTDFDLIRKIENI